MTEPTITIRCPGVPIAQPRQRQRVIEINGRAMAANYTPKAAPINEFKAALRYAASQAHEGPPLEGPLSVRVTFVFPRPKHLVWKSKPMLRQPHAKKPDVDNLQKAVFDGLNNVVWRDDSQIYTVHCRKLLASGDESPHVLIEVWA
jgi:Holliday junction resolvase RusA-like endonuclease